MASPQHPRTFPHTALRAAGAVCAAATLLAGCTAHPGPAPTVDVRTVTGEDAPRPAPAPAPAPAAKNRITIGIDPLRGGFNPHLIADDDAFTRALASLVLPSAFNGETLNTDLLLSADTIAPNTATGAKQTVRYRIVPGAQWSDGTPITGADFAYLATNMANTAGAEDAAGYRAISAVRTSNGGKTVEVDFSHPVADITGLFRHLLPSHLLTVMGVPFNEVLAGTIPASGNRYSVASVDRARGIVVISRNDRFWGQQPANIETVEFRVVRTTTEGAQLLRSGQMAAADITPQETSVDSYQLVPGAQVRAYDYPSRLDVEFSTTSPILSSIELRRALAGLIDVPMVARLAAGRDTQLVPAEPWPGLVTASAAAGGGAESAAGSASGVGGVAGLGAGAGAGAGAGGTSAGGTNTAADNLRYATTNRRLRIGADASDEVAVTAALTIADMLTAAGVSAQPTLTDPVGLLRGVDDGSIDAVVSWHQQSHSPLALATAYGCGEAAPDPATSPGAVVEPVRHSIHGMCAPEIDELAYEVLAGTADPAAAAVTFETYAGAQALSVPLLYQRRLLLGTEQVIGPGEHVAQWPLNSPAGPLSTVATWRTPPTVQGNNPPR